MEHLRLIVTINSVLCAFGVAGALMLAMGSIVSIANMKVPWVGALVVASFLLPVTFVVSIGGSWLAYHWDYIRTAVCLVALPWVYTAGFIVAMLLSFG